MTLRCFLLLTPLLTCSIAFGQATRSDSVDILHTRIDLDLTQVGNGLIAGHTTLRFAPKVNGIDHLPLDLLALTVDSVSYGNSMLSFAHVGELLDITLDAPHDPADTLELTVHYHGDPSIDASGWGGFYTSGNIIYDLGVAFAAVPHSYGRAWFPCFDNFVERCTFEFIVHTNLDRHAWCNGARLSETDLGGGLFDAHWAIAEPIPSYLASVTASTYADAQTSFPSVGGGSVPVDLVAAPGDTTQLKNSFAHLQDAFDNHEAWFGPYRWERVGYCLTPEGSMEHPTNISYAASLADGSLQYETTMAHELGHMWFGDLITCARAEEMYINEGFAEYMSYLFLERVYGRARYMDEVRSNHRVMVHRAHLIDQGWWPLGEMPQQWTYGKTTYNKGADVIHTLRNYLGDTSFRSGFTSFMVAHSFEAVTSQQLRDDLSATTGVDLTDFFNDWIFQPGWAAFEIGSQNIYPNAAGWGVDLAIQQKLRGPADYYHNVPVTVAIIGTDPHNVQRDTVMLGGPLTNLTLNCPFEPRLVWLNDDDRISLAITGETDTITTTGVRNYDLANFQITVNTITDTAVVRIEQYWVAPDDVPVEEQFACVISPDRYWRVSGHFPTTGLTARIIFDGRDIVSGNLDPLLMHDTLGFTFTEDSLTLLYRSGPGAYWIEWSRNVTTLGSTTDGFGRITLDSLWEGEYTLGWRKSAMGIPEGSASEHAWRIYPTPAHGTLTASCSGSVPVGSHLLLLDTAGRILREQAVLNDRVVFSVDGLAPQIAMVVLRSPEGSERVVGKAVVR